MNNNTKIDVLFVSSKYFYKKKPQSIIRINCGFGILLIFLITYYNPFRKTILCIIQADKINTISGERFQVNI
jgi:hypothetical protein